MKAGYILVYDDKVLVKYAEENTGTRAEFDQTAKGLAEAARVLGRWMELEEEPDPLGLDLPVASPQYRFDAFERDPADPRRVVRKK